MEEGNLFEGQEEEEKKVWTEEDYAELLFGKGKKAEEKPAFEKAEEPAEKITEKPEEKTAEKPGEEKMDEKANREKIRKQIEEELEKQFAEGFPDDGEAEPETGEDEDGDGEAEGEEKGETALREIDVDWEAEKICRWGAARSGVIVVAPFVGTMALMANEVYMITRLGELRGVRLDEGTVLGLLGSLGATFVGQTMATFIPFAPLQIPLAISVTYGVGKVANAWLKAGRPEDIAVFREVYDKARRESMKEYEKIKNMDCKDQPLGDESRKFDMEGLRKSINDVSSNLDTIFAKIIGRADLFEEGLAAGIRGIRKAIIPIKERGGRWASVQKTEQLKRGEVILPYDEVREYLDTQVRDLDIKDMQYAGDGKFLVEVRHVKHGTVQMVLSIPEFNVSSARSYAKIAIESFSVDDNSMAEVMVKVLGQRIVLAVFGLIFNRMSLDKNGVTTEYGSRAVTIDFTRAVNESKLGMMRVMGIKMLKLVTLSQLLPKEEGFLLKAKFLD